MDVIMITADEIIDLIRTGYIPPDPGRLGEFGRIVEAVNDLRAQLAAAGQERDEATQMMISERNEHIASERELERASEVRGQDVGRLTKERDEARSDADSWSRHSLAFAGKVNAALKKIRNAAPSFTMMYDVRVVSLESYQELQAIAGAVIATPAATPAILDGVFDHYPRCKATDYGPCTCGVKSATPAVEQSDTARLDWLESECVSGRVGNGIAIFPTTTRLTGELGYTLVDLGDEDVGEEMTDKMPTLRAAIDAARSVEAKESGE